MVQELSSDAWGQLRNPTNQTAYAPDAAPALGFTTGFINGLANGLRSAYKAGENPLTRKPKVDVTADDLGLSSTMDRIKAGESYPHRNDGAVFENKENILPMQQDSEYYREYVHPTPGINGAGIQRIVIGGNKYYYYSPDHYKTFIRFKY